MTTVKVEGRILRSTLGCPVVGLTGRPQTVRVSVDGRPDGVVTLDIPTAMPVGERTLLQLRVGYVFTPAALGMSLDPRRFGVLLQPLRWSA